MYAVSKVARRRSRASILCCMGAGLGHVLVVGVPWAPARVTADACAAGASAAGAARGGGMAVQWSWLGLGTCS